MAFFLCCAVLLFPWALRTGRTIGWLLAVLSSVTIGIMAMAHDTKHRIAGEVKTFEQTVLADGDDQLDIIEPPLEYLGKPEAEKDRIEEPEVENELMQEPQVENELMLEPEKKDENVEKLQVEVAGETETQFPEILPGKQDLLHQRQQDLFCDNTVENMSEHTSSISVHSVEVENSMTVDQLIELGFKQKYSNHFKDAASYFLQALELNPEPDIAFYLILDCYWLWNNLGERIFALTQLEGYIKFYLPQFNPELRHQFDAWVTRENIH